MSEFRTVPVMAGTNLRWGGSTKGDVDAPNIVGPPLSKDDYRALVQCAGQDVKEIHHGVTVSNYWWVLIDTPQGQGWVNAVRIAEGGDNEPIDGVLQAATVCEPLGTDIVPPTVHVVSGGADLYLGVSTRSEPSYRPTPIPAGPYPAFWQCGGEDVESHGQHNFRWVYLFTPQGGGWVSAVYIKEGPNGGPIPGVMKTPTSFATPPDLLPSR